MFIQCGLVFAIHQNKLSISSLCITPTLLLCNIFRPSSAISNHHPLYSIKPLPSTNDLSTNADKLSYLCAWNSIQHSSKVMMNFNPGGKAVCIDSGASSCISNDKNDFIHLEPSANTVLKGISSGLQIEGTGTPRWKITNDMGNEVTLHVHNSLYVQAAPMCLLSPQAVIQQTQKPSDGFQISANKGVFIFAGHQKTVYYNSSTNLLIFFTSTDLQTSSISSDVSSNVAAFLSSVSTPDNLSAIQQKLLHKHQQMGHLNMNRLQDLARQGFLGLSNKALANCDPPLCKACLHGKQHKRPTPIANQHPIDASDLLPGDCVSIDQLESTHAGRIPVYRGSPSSSSYHAGSLFTDHARRFLYFVPHCSTGAEEAVLAKRNFEHLASTHHQSIKRYHADNGVFTTKLFRDACNSQHQQLTLCGVDAHHQNGIAERFIQTITERACTMLIHAMLCWPDTEDLWPFAVQLAVNLHNMTPTSTGLSPLEIFTGAKQPFDSSSCHTFGCPIYVLEPTLRQNHKIPRWKPRSRVGIYLGFSPNHASSIPLVLSTTTGLVSPQYHVVFDDNFTTTTSFKENQVPTNWTELFTSTATCYVDDDFSKTNIYDNSFFETSSSQRESIQPSSASLPQSQRESSISSPVTSSVHFSH